MTLLTEKQQFQAFLQTTTHHYKKQVLLVIPLTSLRELLLEFMNQKRTQHQIHLQNHWFQKMLFNYGVRKITISSNV